MITPIAGVGFAPTHLTDQLMRLVRLTTPPSRDIPLSRTTVNQALPTVTSSTFKVDVSLIQTYAVSIVQPVGIPLAPVTFHVAALFLTNVPLEATPLTQSLV